MPGQRRWEYPAGGYAATSLHLPPEMADPHYTRMLRATDEWAEVFPGFQCRLGVPGEMIVQFRLTPPEGAS